MGENLFFIIAQIVGFVALAMAIISFQNNTRRGILLFQFIAGSIFTIHFLMLGAYTGALLNLIGVARDVVFYYREKKWASSPVWLAFFILVCVGASIFTWSGWYSVLPACGMIFSTVSMWLKTPKLVRLVVFPSSPLWLIYNAITASYAGVITECFVMTSIIIGMIRFDFKRKSAGDIASAAEHAQQDGGE